MLAVIGGTGLQTMPESLLRAEHNVDTVYGAPSSAIAEVEVSGQAVMFLARHGQNQDIPPHRINYRANIKALKHIGVTDIIAVAAVGGVNVDLGVGDLLVPDQLIDYSWGRESTFFDGDMAASELATGRRHVDFTYPYDGGLCRQLEIASASIDRKLHKGGMYACMQGPRLETAAEVRRLRADGVDVVGMTGMPEAILAREIDIRYACLALVVNKAAGMMDSVLSEEEIMAECHRGSADIISLLASLVSERSGIGSLAPENKQKETS